MSSFLIRVSEEQHELLKRAAGAKGLETWAREVLLKAAEPPEVRSTYTLRANTGPVYVEIRRSPDNLSDPRPFLRALDEHQRSAYEQALQFVKRNGPGDREVALAALARGFEEVRESL